MLTIPAINLQDPCLLCRQLWYLINEYNSLCNTISQLQDSNSVNNKKKRSEQLLILQKIDYLSNRLIQNNGLVNTTIRQTLVSWRESDLFETNLQKFSIHRDASFLLRQYEYACAYRTIGNSAKPRQPDSPNTIYTLLNEQYDLIINTSMSDENYAQNVHQLSAELLDLIESDQSLLDKVGKHMDMLSFFYQSLADTRQANSITHLEKYATRKKGGNNQHFFNVTHLVDFRVEQRRFQFYEDQLRSSEAGKYLSEDYTSIMYQDSETTELQPVVLSDYCPEGSLDKLARKFNFQEKSVTQLITVFTQLSDFFLKLRKAGFHHTDIKLQNFLFNHEANQIIAADRKGIGYGDLVEVNAMTCTPLFSPFELTKYYSNNKLNITSAQNVKVAAAPIMAYQVGMALKLYILRGQKINGIEFIDLRVNINAQYSTVLNLIFLADALTRQNPADRLSLENFHALLPFATLNRVDFESNVDRIVSINSESQYNPYQQSTLLKDLPREQYMLACTKALINEGYPLDFDVEMQLLQLISTYGDYNEKCIAYSLLELRTSINKIFMPVSDVALYMPKLYSDYKIITDFFQENTSIFNCGLLMIYHRTIFYIESNFKSFIEITDLVQQFKTSSAINYETTVDYLNRYELSQRNMPRKILSAYKHLNYVVVTEIRQQLLSFVEQRSVIDKFYFWATDKNPLKQITKKEMESHPILSLSHQILSRLEPAVLLSLFDNPDKLSELIKSLYIPKGNTEQLKVSSENVMVINQSKKEYIKPVECDSLNIFSL